MIAYGAPAFLANQLGAEAMPEAKIAKAYELGARAVAGMGSPDDVLTGYQRYPFPAGVMLDPKDRRADLAVAGINSDAAKAIFRNTVIDLYTRVQQMEKDKKPASSAIGVMASSMSGPPILPTPPSGTCWPRSPGATGP